MLSFLNQRWQILAPQKTASLSEQLLLNRNITEPATFCNPDYSKHAYPAQLLKDFPKALKRIERALTQKERILIIGDYDADGITGSALLYQVLRARHADVSVRLPHRLKHGYGLNQAFIQEAAELKVNLIITVDNGSSALAEVTLANQLGIDVIITDHHLPPQQLPPALAIVNPRQIDCPYPNKNLAGAALAFKLASSLNQAPELANELLALATIGTVADLCEMRGENRALVASGLQAFNKIKSFGLKQIFLNAGLEKNFTTEDLGFRIAPRLNAAGRIADPLIAFQTLTHKNGVIFANQLEALNLKRQQLTQATEETLTEHLDLRQKILIVCKPELPVGIIGLVAGKLVEKFRRPALVFTEVSPEILVGSARCPQTKFNLTQAFAQKAALLLKFGGHSNAAGCTLLKNKLPELKTYLEKLAAAQLTTADLTPTLTLDCAVTTLELNCENFAQIKKIAPFGAGNPEPIFYLPNVEIKNLRLIGKKRQHLKFWLTNSELEVVGFNFGEFAPKIKTKQRLDLAVTLTENSWNQQVKLELRLIDLR